MRLPRWMMREIHFWQMLFLLGIGLAALSMMVAQADIGAVATHAQRSQVVWQTPDYSRPSFPSADIDGDALLRMVSDDLSP